MAAFDQKRTLAATYTPTLKEAFLRLIELIERASTWTDDDTTIYVARPWSCDADAILISPAPDSSEPVEQGGKFYDYFLETFIAREVIEGTSESAEQRCQRLIDYAENDA